MILIYNALNQYMSKTLVKLNFTSYFEFIIYNLIINMIIFIYIFIWTLNNPLIHLSQT